MTWEIRIPYRDRDDRLLDEAIGDVREGIADPGDRRVVREVMVGLALEPGVETVGDALDRLDEAGPQGRRQILDRARVAAGLPTTGEAEATRAIEAANAAIPFGTRRDPNGRIPAICGEASCRNFQRDPLHGGIGMTPAKRWWCDEHRAGHEADLEPWTGARLGYTPSGAIVDLDERDATAARDAAEAESRRRQHEARRAEREDEADRLAVFENHRRDQLSKELPPMVPPG